MIDATLSGTFRLGGDLPVHRLGFGAMRITGKGIWGPPADRTEAVAVLRRCVELGTTLIDTAESYGPYVSEELIARGAPSVSTRPRDCDQRRARPDGAGPMAGQRATGASPGGARRKSPAAEARPHRSIPAASDRSGRP